MIISQPKYIFAPFILMLSNLVNAETITIGTVNNGDMKRMQSLSSVFEKQHPDIKLEWVVLDEAVLRGQITKDIAAESGKFDVITIGMYETPIWGKNNWLVPMDNLPASYDVDDIFNSVRQGLSYQDKLYALPFYGESSMTMYRKDLFEKAGLTMPDSPTWDFMAEAAAKIHDPDNGIYGACLRGKAGWGENMALLTTMVNAYGGRWFDMQWQPQFESDEWKNALNQYLNILTNYGPPAPYNNGFNENLSLMNKGHCGFWVDATVAGSFVMDKEQSNIVDKVGFTSAPHQVTSKGSSWLWSWALAVPVTSDAKEAAKTFTTWATSKAYLALVAEKYGVISTPPGTRKSTYANPEYMEQAPFAAVTLAEINSADPTDSTLQENPYTGIQFVAIPRFQSFASKVGKQISSILSGKTSIERGLMISQKIVYRQMLRGKYIELQCVDNTQSPVIQHTADTTTAPQTSNNESVEEANIEVSTDNVVETVEESVISIEVPVE